jgi:hypothetical protein
LVFVCAVLYKLVLLRESLYWGDIFLYFYPQQQMISDALRSGELPLWNPYVLCGQPLVGNPQVWLFYPTTALLCWLPVWAYLTVNAALHLFLAALGTYLYLRRTTGDHIAALFGATAFAGSGVLVARLQFPSMVQAAAYLPWMLLLVDRMVDRQRFWYVGLFAAVTALGVLAAHTQVTYLALMCTGAYGLARLIQIHATGGQALRVLGGMVAGVGVGVVAASVQWLPAVELLRHSTRQALTLAQSNRFVLGPESLIGFILPNFHGNPSDGSYWGRGNFWEPCVYMGLPALLLAGYGAYRGKSRPLVRFWGVEVVASTLLAMGTVGGLYVIAYYLLPGMKSFHDPARFMLLAVFGLACLASIGMRLLRDSGIGTGGRLSLLALSLANLWWFSAHINPTLEPAAFRYRPRALALAPKAGDGRLLTAQRERIWERYLNYDDYGPDSARYAHELADTLAPNVGARFGIEEASGYEPVPIRASTEVDGLLRQSIARRAPHLGELLTVMNAEAILLPLGTPYSHPSLTDSGGRGAAIYRRIRPEPRAWTVGTTYRVESPAERLELLASADFKAKGMAIVAGPGARDMRVSANSESREAATEFRGLNRIQVHPAKAASEAFLVIGQAWYPGWTARTRGERVPLVSANHAFAGVYLRAGSGRVELRYAPDVVRIAMYFSLIGAAAIAALLTAGHRARSVLKEQGSAPALE